MHPDRSLAGESSPRATPSSPAPARTSPAVETAIARFERPRVTGRPPAARPILDVRARAIARAISEELAAWRLALSEDDERRVDLSCHVELVAAGERWVGHTESIGARGAFVATYLAWPLGERVELRIELPTGRSIEATATVVGQRPPGGRGRAGLQLAFGPLSDESARELSEVLRVMSGELWSRLAA